MGRLIMLSNRVADLSRASQWGGLSVALADALKSIGGIWFGWDGTVDPAGLDTRPNIMTVGNLTTVRYPFIQRDYDEYYLGYCNCVLWPVFHYRLDLVRFEPAFLSTYFQVNAKLAAKLSAMLEQDDVIWVHDYHLIPLASELRKLGHQQRIGFFLHIPFPSPEVITAAPGYIELLDAFGSYDLVGFQTTTDLENYKNVIAAHRKRNPGTNAGPAELRVPRTGRFPIGIDVETFRSIAKSHQTDTRVDSLRAQTKSHSLILGVDRLDYTKGLPDRLVAFRRLLREYPALHKTVTMMQIAAPTREQVEAYTQMRDELEKLSGSINGEFADIDWTPVRYIHRTIPRNILAALFRSSEIGFVTPLRDGMNLVAKEYVAAQDDEDPGVLVLSKFAGAAEELQEAMIVNPFDIDAMAETLNRALHLPKEERIERQRALLQRIRRHDAHHWQKGFLNALSQNKMAD